MKNNACLVFWESRPAEKGETPYDICFTNRRLFAKRLLKVDLHPSGSTKAGLYPDLESMDVPVRRFYLEMSDILGLDDILIVSVNFFAVSVVPGIQVPPVRTRMERVLKKAFGFTEVVSQPRCPKLTV